MTVGSRRRGRFARTRRARTERILAGAAIFAMAAALLVAAPGSVPLAQAATYDVTRTDDPTPDGCAVGDCSLREAILIANLTPDDDVINVPAGTYTMTILGDGEDAAATGDLDIPDTAGSGTLTLQGDGLTLTVINVLGIEDRAFHVLPGGVLTLNDLQVTGGRTQSGTNGVSPGEPGGDGVDGAGLRNDAGFVTLDGVVFTNNVTGTGGNGVSGNGGSPGQPGGDGGRGGNGAAIYSTGPLTISDSTIFDNRTGVGGAGGVGADGDGSGAPAGPGGVGGAGGSGSGIYFDAPGDVLTINNTTLDVNVTGSGGAGADGGFGGLPPGSVSNGIAGGAGGAGGPGGDGSGLYIAGGTADLFSVGLGGNISGSGGVGGSGGNGGPSSDDSPAVRGGAGGAGGEGGHGGFGTGIYNAATLNLAASAGPQNSITSGDGGTGASGGNGGDGSTEISLAQGGHAGPYGQNGAASNGVGIYNVGTAAVADTVLIGNDGDASGEFGVAGTPGTGPGGNGFPPLNPSVFDLGLARGIGIANLGDLTVTDALIDSNLTGNQGGGLYNELGAADLTRVLITGNDAGLAVTVGAPSVEEGGGIFNVGGAVTVLDSTISGNTASYRGGGIANKVGDPFGSPVPGVVDLKNVTISGNSAAPIDSQRGGGGIYALGLGSNDNQKPTTILNNVTVTENGAPSGGGIFSLNVTNFVVANSIVAGNVINGGGTLDPEADCDGFSFRTGDHNLIGTLGGPRCDNTQFTGPNDQVGAPPPGELDALLGPLADNGFPAAPSHELLAGSPAIGAGNPAPPSDAPIAIPGPSDPLPSYLCRASDQRGQPRANCDVGAFQTAPAAGPLQALIDAAGAGGTANVPPGTYNENIIIDESVTVLPDVPGTVTIVGDSVGTTVSILAGATADISDLTITGGGASGVVLSATSAATLTNVDVTGNSSSGSGGGINNDGTLVVVGGSVSNNSTGIGGFGGAIANSNALTLDGVTMTGNATNGGNGGAVYNTGVADIVNGSVLEANTAGGGAAVWNVATLNLSDSVLRNNGGSAGGAIYNEVTGTVVAVDTDFEDNSGSTGGGAIWNDGGDVDITRGTFLRNHSGFNAPGGAIDSSQGGTLTIVDTAFIRNGGGTSGALRLADDVSITGATFEGNVAGWEYGQGGSGGAIRAGAEGGSATVITDTLFINNAAIGPQSTPVTDQSNLPSAAPSAVSCGAVGGSFYQGFVPSASTLSWVSVRVLDPGGIGPGGLTVGMRIREADPQGPVVAHIDGFVPGPDPANTHVVLGKLPAPLEVTPGNLYIIEVYDLGEALWWQDPANPYPAAQSWVACGGGGGVPLSQPDTDYDFETGNSVGNGTQDGGAISTGTGTMGIFSSEFIGNIASASGGAIDSSSVLTISDTTLGPGNLAAAGRGGALNHGLDPLDFVNSHAVGNYALLFGGGLNVTGNITTIEGSSIRNNASGREGGGLRLFSNTAMTGTEVSGNTSGVTQIGLPTANGGKGGGIFNRGDLDLSESAIVDNLAVGGDGGGISNFDGANLTAENSTIALNTTVTGAIDGGLGGGIANDGGGSSVSVSLNHVTVAFNSSDGQAGGIFNTDVFDVANTIISDNTATGAPACSGTPLNSSAAGHNVVYDGSPVTTVCGLVDGVNGDIVGFDPLLGTVQRSVFFDDFEGYSVGTGQSSFGPWSTQGGADVDIFGATESPQFCPGTQCVDLAGTLSAAEPELSATLPELVPGSYMLSFDLGGNASTESTEVTVSDGTGILYSEIIVTPAFAPFATENVVFVVADAPPAVLSFKALDGTDNRGALLDNVKLIRLDGVTSLSAPAPTSPAIDAGDAATCPAIDQLGTSRPVGTACDVGAIELALIPTVSLSLNTAPVVDSGASTIATASLPSPLATQPTDPTDPTDDNIGSAPIANLDTQSADVAASPIANLPIANLAPDSTPIANLPIANLPAAAQSVVDAILLIDVPIEGGWETHLAASSSLVGRPVQSVTFGEAMADAAVLGSLEAAGLSFNDMNLASTPIANLTIAGLALGNLPIANLQLDPADTTPGDILQGWCDALASQPVNCSTLGINPAGPDDGGHSLASLSIAGADLSTLPIANLPIANLDTISAPIANLPIANLEIEGLLLAASPIANLPIANLPIANLDPSGLPIANLPIANLPIANLDPGGLPIANLPIANLPIANLELTTAPIANIPIANLHVDGAPIANLPIANLPIANLPIANLPIANLPIANLANFVDCSQPAVFDCNNPGDATVGALFQLGLLLGTVTDWAPFLTIDDLLVLGATDAAGAPYTIDDFVDAFLGTTLLDLVDPPGGQLANLGSITLIELADYLGMTLGELIVALIQSGLDFVLGDILLLLVSPEDYPWEDLELDGIDLQQFDPNAAPTLFSAQLDVASGGGSPAQVVVDLPAGFVFVAVDVTGPGGPAAFTHSMSGQAVTVDIAAIGDGTTTIDVEASASLTLGPAVASASVDVAGVLDSDLSLLQVAEVLEPNDVPETATEAAEDTLYLTHIAQQDDIDMYKISGVASGSRISVSLSNMSEDFDLVLYQPELPPLRPGGVTPEGIATGVSDPGGYVDGDEQIQNEVSGDFPRATFADGTALKLYETSTQQGTSDEVITTAALQASGDYYVQVHGSNGNVSAEPYALRVEVIESATTLACLPLAKPFDGEGSPGSVFTAGPGPYNTLILYNEERLGDMYGADAADGVRDALQNLAGLNNLGVNAIVVPVESDPLVAAEYDDWDDISNRCNPLAANELAAQIGRLVDEYRAANPTIEYITLVGDDGQIPFFRVPDYTEIANESEYALSVSSTNNELVGSLLAGFVLTDDPYGDAQPLLVDGRELYISELPMGRLVETPADILQTVNNFEQFSGRLDPATTSTGLSTGYDFIEDGANAIATALDGDPRRSTTTLNSDLPGPLWDSQALSSTIDSVAADVISLGAHMSHDSLLSAAEDTAGTQADLYDTTDAANQLAGIFEGGIIFSMGCHSGLSVSDVQVGTTTTDWAQAFSSLGAVYVAETGFGYGDTEIVAYGEELMRQFAARLNGSMTIGQAMGFAKQLHGANLSQFSPYDEKVIMETVMYGLPFYAVGNPAIVPPAPVPLPQAVDPATGLPVVATTFDVGDGAAGADGQFDLVAGGDRGDYYTVNDEAQATAFNPIQPRITRDVTQPGLVGTGVFISELTSVDKLNFDPVFSRPTVDLAAREPELSLPGTFPLVLPGLNSYLDFDGQRDQLVVVLGQFTDTDGRGLVGTERLFTHVKANVLYGDPSDVLLPTLRSVEAVDGGAGGVLSFSVEAFDQDGVNPGTTDVARVYVLYKLVGVDGAWQQLDLTQAGDRWVGTVPSLGGKVEYIVQAVDFSGLVAVHSNKTAGNESTDQPAPPNPVLGVELNGEEAEPVYNSDPVTIEITGAGPDDPITVDVDGNGFMPYDGPFDVTGEGTHVITIDDGSGAEPGAVVFTIDTTGPEVFISSPVAGTIYETGSELVAAYSCTDAGTGAASCSGSIGGSSVANGSAIDTSVPGVNTLTVMSTDQLGNQSVADVTFEIADPIALAVDPAVVPLGDPVTGLVAFTPGFHEHQVLWDWGDGSTDLCTSSTCVDEASGSSMLDHTYAEAGVYRVTVTVTHEGGGTQTLSSDFVVVYDTSSGFVTGGGWFESPFGAFTPDDPLDPEVTGRAHFGFVSKYKRGKAVPEGNTSFRIESAAFRFSSTSYEWLIVSGDSKAMFAGVGEIEGWNGEFNFRITLRDADGNPNDAFVEDSIRVVIWQDDGTETGWIVYDSGHAEDEDGELGATIPIGGGSIVIHTGGRGRN